MLYTYNHGFYWYVVDKFKCAYFRSVSRKHCFDFINGMANKNARLLFIMAHIQKQNITLLPSLISSMLRHLKKSNEDHAVELVLLKQFEDRPNVKNTRSYKRWLSDFKKALKVLEQQHAGKKLLNMIPVWAWLRHLEEAGQNRP